MTPQRKHRPESFPPNRLARETSPYLLQHAHNPVNWYPWSEEALAQARRENKPIFLSIGYSACHWCHVMERESFEDEETARILNAYFIAVKVDREERPDLDEIYMTAVQMLTGAGGWPLSVFLTPDGKPFFGGTYFPPEQRHGMPSFRAVLNLVAETWKTRPEELLANAKELTAHLRAHSHPEPATENLSLETTAERALAALRHQFDPLEGGFGGPPKFPSAAAISLLLRRYAKTRKPDLLHMIVLTLDRMAQGGIYDQIGGGFHRYSVDARWRVPHFEKMLYDNALLSLVYLEAWELTRRPLYRRIAAETLDYVLRDMTHPRGGFYSAEDADSEGREGRFYLWTMDEIRAALGEEDALRFHKIYPATVEGNFEGGNILYLSAETFRQEAEKADSEDEALELLIQSLEPLRARLLEARAPRPRPARDEKILAAWNGMMISSLARACQAFGEDRYLRAAEKAADFILSQMIAEDGGLLRIWSAGAAKQPAFLDDYAELINGLLDLYETSFNPCRLDAAESLAQAMIRNFWDEKDGAFYFTDPDHHPDLLIRTKPFYDGVTPSGNAAAALALARLGKFLENDDYLEKATKTIAFNDSLARMPQAFLNMLIALSCLESSLEIVIVGAPDAPDTQRLLGEVRRRFLPDRVLLCLDPAAPDTPRLRKHIPVAENRETRDNKAVAYVCRNFACEKPVSNPAALGKLLD